MRLPKRIADILKKKQDFIDSRRGLMENTYIKQQTQLLSDIITDLIPQLDVKDGLIQETVKNYRLISSLDKTYKNSQLISNQVVLSQITATTAKLATLNTNYFEIVLAGNLPARFANVVEKTNKLINLYIGIDGQKLVTGGFLDSYFKSGTGTELKQMTAKAVTTNMDLKEYAKSLKNLIVGTEEKQGLGMKQFNNYAADLYQTYDSAYNKLLGNEFGFTYFIYQGGLIGDSRDFCAAHNNKVWSVEEVQDWANWTPSQGEYPVGYEVKAKDIYAVPSYLGYPGYDPLLNLGGYRCRHMLGWISDELAFKMRPDLNNHYEIAKEFIEQRNLSTRSEYLSPLTIDDLYDAKIITLNEGKTGCVITSDGDLKNVFNNAGKGEGGKIIELAINNGAKKLDCYDGFLPDHYKKFGFEEVSRVKWDDQYAPPNWNYKTGGRPDIVFMELKK